MQHNTTSSSTTSSTTIPTTATNWTTSTIADFTSTRNYLNDCHGHKIGAKEEHGGISGPRVALPRHKDLSGWCNDVFNDETGMLPSVKIVLQMDQVMVRKVISNLVDLCDERNDGSDEDEGEVDDPISYGWTQRRGLWLYVGERSLTRSETTCRSNTRKGNHSSYLILTTK